MRSLFCDSRNVFMSNKERMEMSNVVTFKHAKKICTTECIEDLDWGIIFESLLPLLKWASFFEAAEAVATIGLSRKPNHYNQVIIKLNRNQWLTLKYRVYKGQWLNLGISNKMIFLCHFWPLLMWATIFVASRLLLKNVSSLKQNHYYQAKLVQIPDIHGS